MPPTLGAANHKEESLCFEIVRSLTIQLLEVGQAHGNRAT